MITIAILILYTFALIYVLTSFVIHIMFSQR